MKNILDTLIDLLLIVAEFILFLLWIITYPLYYIGAVIVDNIKRKWL